MRHDRASCLERIIAIENRIYNYLALRTRYNLAPGSLQPKMSVVGLILTRHGLFIRRILVSV